MKLGLTAKALALAVAVGISSQAMADTTNGWWNIDFENVATITALTNEASFATGKWTTSEDDESTIETDKTNYLKLDTQGTDLTWTPDAPSSTPVVLVNADMYLVGSDSEPTGFDTDTGKPVQTAVYLKNYIDDDSSETTNSVLCAYVAEGENDNKWIELSGVSMADTNWYTIKIEVDYSPGGIPVARFYVGNEQLFVDAADAFPIANYKKFATEGLQKINSVSFRGTGAVDNFVAQEITPTPAAQLTFTVETYTDNVQDGVLNAGMAPISGTVTAGNDFGVIFQLTDAGTETKHLTAVRVYTNATQYVDYDVTYNAEDDWTLEGPLTYDGSGFNITLTLDTTGMTEGTTIKGYYGEDPLPDEQEPTDPTAPEIGGAIGEGNVPVAFEIIEEVEYFCVTFVAPEAGVTYTLQTAADLGEAFTDSADELAEVTSIEADEVITLKAPTGGATKKFFRVKAALAEVS